MYFGLLLGIRLGCFIPFRNSKGSRIKGASLVIFELAHVELVPRVQISLAKIDFRNV